MIAPVIGYAAGIVAKKAIQGSISPKTFKGIKNVAKNISDTRNIVDIGKSGVDIASKAMDHMKLTAQQTQSILNPQQSQNKPIASRKVLASKWDELRAKTK
ncbi:MAG: hypothetical protein ACJAQ0_001191 [Dasania sp.]|jgi:hypothetical protein